MGYPRFDWTPYGGTAVSVQWDSVSTQISAWQGGPRFNREDSFTDGGKSFSVVHNAYNDFILEALGIRPSRGSTWRALHEQIALMWAHMGRGGQAAFAMDSAQRTSTTIGAAAYTDTIIDGIASTTGFLANHDVYFEDADDSTLIVPRRRILTVDSGTQVTLVNAIGRPLVATSIMRHAEYLPICRALDDEFPLKEREGGKGADMWDLKMKLRAVR